MSVAPTAPGLAPRLRVGVRDLARFALRRGDLERSPAGPDAQAGSRAHRRLQRDSGLQAEVALSRTAILDGTAVTVSGRIDLCDTAGQRLIEIKSTLVPAERLLPGRRALDRAQLELYAWLQAGALAPTDGGVVTAPAATLELHYVNLRSDTVQCERWAVEPLRIDGEVQRALRDWVGFQHRLRLRRDRLHGSIADLAFPHGGFRPGQRRLAAAVYRSVADRVPLLLEAPTGTGKTLGVLYPAVRGLRADGAQRLIWLTAKTSGREAVFAALRQLGSNGLRTDALLVRSRRDGCFCERDPALRDAAGLCAFATGYHDRLPGARSAAIGDGEAMRLLDGEALDALGAEHRVCPHALALELLPWATVVIADYNHLLDPVSALPALGERIERSVVLIDEAHNLPDRARQMFCARLARLDVLAARTSLLSSHPEVARALHRLSAAMLALARRAGLLAGPGGVTGEARAVDDRVPLCVVRAVHGVLETLAASGAEMGGAPPPLPVVLVHALHRFTAVSERFGGAHRCVLQRRRAGRRHEIVVELTCLDAREELAGVLTPAHAVVAFSAVLGPPADSRDALGLPVPATVAIRGESPFEPGRLLCQLIDWIPVRYAQREASLPALIRLIVCTVEARSGHYLVFLPSHAWLERLADAFARAQPDTETWRQSRDRGDERMSERLARLDRAGTTVGFVITGGVYGEGIDYAGDRLIGAIVIGTALPGRDVATEMMIEHHVAQRRPGYDLVCRHPALVRVLQSAGRIIRTPHDRGVLLLVDERFDDAFQRRWRPPHWRMERPRDQAVSTRAIVRFWQGLAVEAAGGSAGERVGGQE